MISKILASESEHNHSFHTNLSYFFQSFSSEIFPKFHCESCRHFVLLSFGGGDMESNSVLDQQIVLVLSRR